MARTPAPSTRTRAIAYLRVSTDKQADEGVSLEAQRAKLEAYASLYDLDLVAVEVDAGASAKSLDRPALGRALAGLRAGRADALLVVKLDRLTRSVRDLGELLDGYFGAGKPFALLSVADQIDTRTAAGRMVLNILTSVAQWEREAIGERTAAAMQHKAAQGEYCGGQVPYGFAVGLDGVWRWRGGLMGGYPVCAPYAWHQIFAQTELFPMAEVNQAVAKVRKNEVRYRAVLVR